METAADFTWPQKFLTALRDRFGNQLRLNEPLANHTTSRLGGPADIWLPVHGVEELAAALTLARAYRIPIFVLGGGANLLVSDAGIRGLVINNRAGQVVFPEVKDANHSGPVTITVESGAIMPSLARRCAQRSLSGFEWAVGIPGTIGGAIVNNAGAYGADMAGNLVRAELFTPDGGRLWQPVEWFEYGYRTSRLKGTPRGKWVVLQAELSLKSAKYKEIQARTNAFNERRKSSQPPGATMGSIFKNPPDDFAGRLIDEAGLKGYQIGQAQISPVHANFFQNLGQATAADMLALIKKAQVEVEARFDVKLELEIEVVGESHKA